MRGIYLFFGLLLLGSGIFTLVQYSNHSTIWFAVSLVLSVAGARLLNPAKLPNGYATQQMLVRAREKWLLGIVAVGLFVLGFLLVTLGSAKYFNYCKTYPWLTLIGFFQFGGTAGFLLWRYLRFVMYGVTSFKTIR